MARECRGNLNEVMRRLAGENAGLARKWSAARRVSVWMAAPLYRYAMNDAWRDGVIPVGNAASAIEPVGGEGMGLAMATAELVAGTLVKYGPRLDDDATRRLRAGMRKLSSWRGIKCRAIAMLLSRPELAATAMTAAAANPMLAESVMRLVKGGFGADII
jgi:flavin-dependent dehydrogenase